MKLGISANKIMQTKFPIVDINTPIEKCLKKLNSKNEACVVLKNGYFYTILSFNELIQGFLKRKNHKDSLQNLNIKIKRNFETIYPDTDISEAIKSMKHKNTDFIIVKNKNNILGLITKKEIIEIETLYLEEINEL